MSEQEATIGVAVAERDDEPNDVAAEKPKRGWFGRGKKQDPDDEPEHELEFMTPFGKVELEFEPTPKKQERDRKKREKAEREAAKAEAAAAKRAEQEAKDAKLARRAVHVEAVSKSGGGGLSKLLIVLAVFGAIAAAVGIAVFLFARKPEDLDSVPPEYRAVELEPEPEGFVPKMRHRLRHALREGQQASREAQLEQQQRYEDLTRGT